MKIDFKNKLVLISGGTGSIGTQFVESFKKLGAEVVFFGSEFDFSCKKDLIDLRQHIDQKRYCSDKKSYDILINCAGIIETQELSYYDIEDDGGRTLFDINFHAAAQLIQLVSLNMKSNGGGKIINIASIAANRVRANRAFYSASKAALVSLTKSAALELAEYNILVNSISPCFTEGGMTQDMGPNEKDRLIKQIPLGRFAKAEDIVNTALFLCSDYNKFITGQDIVVDGGFSNSII